MTINQNLYALALSHRCIDKMVAAHPTMNLHTAHEAIKLAIIHAMAAPQGPDTLDEAAAEIINSPAIQEQLPPWD